MAFFQLRKPFDGWQNVDTSFSTIITSLLSVPGKISFFRKYRVQEKLSGLAGALPFERRLVQPNAEGCDQLLVALARTSWEVDPPDRFEQSNKLCNHRLLVFHNDAVL
ncbi:hypothetical protein PF010_g6228 [Phytophthora fragariae]|uniref:Uncharacterized protein n=1 Tax=Phytophthora fragariae TaxID=53985 RepID=A0A6A3SSK4_9STRA|nr:hypothetical protein PF011_g12368 [Phytophthora fragariae]KAE9123143.1 hypothetical protein PF007_g7174 [Phytophthora fragariae]KAE9123846.1 hypothetical protein PF010_g6228 [Phytophthora fragariae]KAE9149456.1 hypothetical protein PF006_g6058 [Phytophthora fragariae]KAE9243844.1 hypothetical protein PF004_g5942 [Phytophthora fragariae]